jgi:DNA-binding LacI/PurR family transcriptional regulator
VAVDMSKRVTIKDVAKALNISVATVSRAMRNAADVNCVTRQRVLAYTGEVNYEPSFIAQSLVKQSTKIIGVIVPSINSNYFSQALSGMTDVAEEQAYHVMICQSNEQVEIENRSIRKLLSCSIDGLLISFSKNTPNADGLKQLREQNLPLVMFDRIIKGLDCSKVIVDEYEGAFKAVEYLIHKSCRKIAHLGGPVDLSVSYQRKQGYLDALQKHHIPVNPNLIAHSKSFEEDAIYALQKIMKSEQLPDAIFCINDLSAITAIRYLAKKGFKIPGDIKVVGFNNDPVSGIAEPSLTTVMQPGYEVGKLAMGVLIDEITGKRKTKEFQTYQLRTKLIVRQSTK